MSYCSALLKSGKVCTYKAKYVLLEYNLHYCKSHALSHSNLKMNSSYEAIDAVPNLQELGSCAHVSENIFEEIISDIAQNHNRQLKIITKSKIKIGYELVVTDINTQDDKFILKVAKSMQYIDQMIDASAAYASLLSNLTNPICIPLISYMNNGQLRLIRGWKYGQWYYELRLISYPLLMNDHKKLITRLVDLLICTHSNRLVYGSIQLHDLVQIKQKRISTTVFESLKNALFWQGRYGQTIDSDTLLDSDITFDQVICARRMNNKIYPCRYDDFESLLYLALQLINYDLPWIGLTNNNEIAAEKEQFIINQANKKDQSPLSIICKMINDSHYDDRPNYSKLHILFSTIMNE